LPKITFHHQSGRSEVVDVDEGVTVMRAALSHGIGGIIGECGGQAMCATCHVNVREPYIDRLAPMSEDEDEMLDCTASPRDDRRSRLGCQIEMGAGLDEVELDVPWS
jgi:2Fe-2S ferredoxin